MALWHERDISHSSVERVALPDATILLDYGQHLAVRVVEGMTVDAERMQRNLDSTHGALYSQRALLALVESGLSRDEAYRIVQANAQKAFDEGVEFRDLLAEAAPELDLDAIFDPRRLRGARGGDRGAAGLAEPSGGPSRRRPQAVQVAGALDEARAMTRPRALLLALVAIVGALGARDSHRGPDLGVRVRTAVEPAAPSATGKAPARRAAERRALRRCAVTRGRSLADVLAGAR